MRAQWYGDNRDLVKWGILLSLAGRFNARHILQVLYWRPSNWGKLEIDGAFVEVPSEVLGHFRSAAGISGISSHVPVELVADSFEDRAEYLEMVIQRIHSRRSSPGIVFLDPDTGLESGSPGLQHVLNSELATIWAHLLPGDVLVFYQHQTNRDGSPWIEPKKTQFEDALGIPRGASKVARSEAIARDVVFLYSQKSAG